MGWRNHSSRTSSSGGFAEGFANAFVPAYNASLDRKAKKEQAEEARKHDMELLQTKEALFRQRPRTGSSRKSGAASEDDNLRIIAMSEELNIPYGHAARLFYSNQANSRNGTAQFMEGTGDGTYSYGTIDVLDKDGNAIKNNGPTDIVPEKHSAVDPNNGASVEGSHVVAEAPSVEDNLINTNSVAVADATIGEDGTTAESIDKGSNFTGETYQVASLNGMDSPVDANDNGENKQGEVTPGVMSESIRPQTRPEGLGSPSADLEPIRPQTRPEDLGSTSDDLESTKLSGEIQENGEVTSADLVANGVSPTNTVAVPSRFLNSYFKFTPVGEIKDLDQAKTEMQMLELRSRQLAPDSEFGGSDDFHKAHYLLLSRKIESLTVLPDFGKMLGNNNRIGIKNFVEGGYKDPAYSTANKEELMAAVERGKVFLSNPNNLPPITGNLQELLALQSSLETGKINPANVPEEWRIELSKRITQAETNDYASRISTEYIFGKDRTKEELLSQYKIFSDRGAGNHPVALTLKSRMAQIAADPEWGLIARGDITSENYYGEAILAENMGNPVYAAEIRAIGMARADKDPERVKAATQVLSMAHTVINSSSPALKDYNSKATTFVSATNTAATLSEMASANELVLTRAGQLIPSLVSTVSEEFSAVGKLLFAENYDADIPDATIDIASGLSALDNYSEDLKALYESQGMEKAEYDAARFAALERKFAFSIAIMQQGENGVVSNQDYNNALKQIRGSKVPEVYAATLRTLVADDLPKVNMAYQTVQNDIGIRTAIKMLDEAGMDSSIYSRFTISLDERFAVLGEDRGKAVQAWLYEKPTATPPKVDPQVGPSGPYVDPPQAMADEEAMYQQFLKDFKTPVNATPAQLNAMADRLEREQRDKQ